MLSFKLDGLDALEQSTHLVFGVLYIDKHVITLLAVDANDAITVGGQLKIVVLRTQNLQQVALKSQCHWRLGRHDGLACL